MKAFPFLVAVSPAHVCDPSIAIAATRANAAGILDLGLFVPAAMRRAAVDRLHEEARGDAFGVRCDPLGVDGGVAAVLAEAGLTGERRLPLVLLAAPPEGKDVDRFTAESLAAARRVAEKVVLEAVTPAQAFAAEAAGFDAVLLKGNEAGGRVGPTSAFLFLQHVHDRLRIPFWVQGGIGPQTAAAAEVAGAAAVVLCEQFWLTRESPLPPQAKEAIRPLDGSETLCLGDERGRFRFLARAARARLLDLDRSVVTGGAWPDLLVEALRSDASDPPVAAIVPAGQEIGMAARLADLHRTVAGVIQAFELGISGSISATSRRDALATASPWCSAHRTALPIVQGPMTRVSDSAAFCEAVADAGALPFLALALLRGPAIRRLLSDVAARLGGRSWGVGMLGFVQDDLRREQLAEVLANPPSFALIAGGRPAQARDLEQQGIPTYLHVPSRGLLRGFLDDGARRFVLEGRECGGHVGPQSSFALWQSAIDVLLDANIPDPGSVDILFAGGIHDGLSAALVAAIAAPLVERGMRIAVLMGTAYLFTREAVETGAITAEFQRQSLACTATALVESDVGYATRCVPTPFVGDFAARKRALVAEGATPLDVRGAMEVFNVGRLRLASKGVARPSLLATAEASPARQDVEGEIAAELSPVTDDLVAADVDTQRRLGMYMIGEVATLRDRVVDVAELHRDVVDGAAAFLARSAIGSRPLPRRRGCEPLAIVGMGCKFPDASDLRTYWANLLRGHDAIRPIPPGRWDPEEYYSSDRFARDRVASKWGGFIPDGSFDPIAYSIPPASLFAIEPVQLLALEVAATALHEAGYGRADFPRSRTSVIFASAGMHDLALRYVIRAEMRQFLAGTSSLDDAVRKRLVAELEASLPEWTEDSFPGILTNLIAGRIANRFDLAGPNLTVDAACASSLAALQSAAVQLRTGICDAAVVGAADANSSAFTYMCFSKTQALSPAGRSKSFDAAADGIAIGEGIAAVVVKRLADAERDGDRIRAVILGVGASSDGRSTSLTAPAAAGQRLAFERAYEDAGVSPATVSLVEAHATGTAVGDRVEVEAIAGLLSDAGAAPRSVAVGSVKSMIGHTKTAAGLAGLVKATLALEHRVLPPTIGIDVPVAPLRAADSPLYPNTDTRPWFPGHGQSPRRAAVSAFGFGGANYHAILEEHRGSDRGGDDLVARSCELLVWRRGSRGELAADLREFRDRIDSIADDRLAALGAAAWIDESRRPAAPDDGCRLAIVATGVDDLRRRLDHVIGRLGEPAPIELATALFGEGPPARPAEVAFLFPGQGSQRIGMLRDLVVGHADLHHLFETADDATRGLLGRPLTAAIYPPPIPDGDPSALRAAIDATDTAQPALAVADLFCHELLRAYGIEPALVAGHSFGDLVALAAAGVLAPEALFRLAAHRGRAVSCTAGGDAGAMAAVGAGLADTRRWLEESAIEAWPANVNAPDQTVIGGSSAAIREATRVFAARGIACRTLAVTAAFHTPLMADAAREFARHLAATVFHRPAGGPVFVPPGDLDTACGDSVRDELRRQLVSPVLFTDRVRAMHDRGARVFVEAGPGSVLTGLVPRILVGRPFTALALSGPGGSEWESLGGLLGRLWCLGLPVRVGRWFERRGLAEGGVADLVRRADAPPKPSDWVVNASVARPVSGFTQRRPTEPPAPAAPPRSGPIATAPVATPTPRTHAPTPSPLPPAAPFLERGPTMTDGPQDRDSSHDAGRLAGILETQQRLMSQWIEMQSRQMEASTKFLESHERIMLACLGAGGPSAPLPPSASRPAMPVMPVVEAPAKPVATPSGTSSASGAAASPAAPAVPAPAAKSPQVARPAVLAPLSVKPATVQAPAGPPSAPAAAAIATQAEANGSAAGRETRPPTEQFRRALLAAVADRTGYPVEMLKEDASIVSDLGIDSIKMLEIYRTLADYHRYMPSGGTLDGDLLVQFSSVKTLRDLVAMYDRSRAEAEGAGTPLVAPVAVAEHAIERFEVRLVAAAPLADAVPRAAGDDVVLIVGDGEGLAERLAGAISPAPVVRLRQGADGHRDGAEHADLGSAESLAACQRRIAGPQGRRVGCVVNLLATGAATPDDVVAPALAWLHVLQAFSDDLRRNAAGTRILDVTTLGRRTRPGGRPALASAAMAGLSRAAAREFPNATARSVDISATLPVDRHAAIVVGELAAAGDPAEVGHDEQGRWTTQAVPAPLGAADLGPLPVDSDSVIVVTGGATGVTAAATLELARQARPRIVLVGRSPLPGDEPEETRRLDRAGLRTRLVEAMLREGPALKPAEIDARVARTLKDREILATILALRAAGARVEYHAVDVRDGAAFSALLRSVRAAHGRIDGVIHGAGIVEDRSLGDKTDDSFRRVYSTKVDAALTILRELPVDSLAVLAFFASVSGRFGSRGQADYAAANASLDALAAGLAEAPATRVVAVDWGPWCGGMVSEELLSHYAHRGIETIDPVAGAREFVRELRVRRPAAAQVIMVAGTLAALDRVAGAPPRLREGEPAAPLPVRA
jgi:acyl transferase domain-containing protein/NAD(P)H-dependent flavin oxidoreductase YrpB (nitropropane dioxygenase family)/NADP-dependent 3-hydroxy acid dehydrogenase YdfG